MAHCLMQQWLVSVCLSGFSVALGLRQIVRRFVRTELVLPEGYPLEEHTIETADGYLLSVYRMRAGRLADPVLPLAG